MILSYKQTTSKCAHCGRSITLDGVWPRPFKALGFWYHDDFVDVDCSGYSIGSSCTSLTYGPRFALTLTKAIEHDQPKVRNVRLDVDNRIENR